MVHAKPEEPRAFSARPIGVVRSLNREASGTPIQPAFAEEVEAEVVVDGEFEEALKDLEGFERIWLVTWLDRTRPFRPLVVPYRDTRHRGLFATRAPSRPNPIGLSVVRLIRREGRVLHIRGCDLLDGTPVLDIKPYVPGVRRTSRVRRRVARRHGGKPAHRGRTVPHHRQRRPNPRRLTSPWLNRGVQPGT
jgi:tRNA-Thr(GGU) m(6)t(6)A37 methyltransferase TsaA